MEDLVKIKRQLKEWESAFFKVHERKPSKDDIAQAPSNIKDLYKKYHSSRKSSSTVLCPDTAEKCDRDSTTQIPANSGEGDANEERQDFSQESQKKQKKCSSPQDKKSEQAAVWGLELNKSSQKSHTEMVDGKTDSGSLLGKLGEKLFAKCSSGVLKSTNIPKKNVFITPVRETCDVNQRATPTGSSPSEPSIKCSTDDINETSCQVQGALFEKAKRLSVRKRVNTSDTVEVPRKFQQTGKLRRQFLPSGMQHLPTEEYEVEENDSSIKEMSFGTGLNNGGMRSVKTMSPEGSFCQHDYVNSPSNIKVNPVLSPSVNTQSSLDEGLCRKGTLANKSNKTRLLLSSLDKPSSSSSIMGPPAAESASSLTGDGESNTGVSVSRPRGTRTTLKSQHSHQSLSSLVDSDTMVESPPSPHDSRVDSDGADFGESAAFGENDAAESSSTKGRAKGRPRAPAGKRKSECATAIERKRRKVEASARDATAESVENIDENGLTDKYVSSGNSEVAKTKVTRSSAASISRRSDNFVKLNMKVKRYCRKGSRMTNGQWKRKQWKMKMAARSKSYGNKCFKCGEEGHWANKCPSSGTNSGPSLMVEIEPVNEQEFPSLRSAALMARGISVQQVAAEPEEDEELAVEAMVVRERPETSCIHSSTVAPFVQLVEDIEDEVKQGLKTFGFTSFKPGQKQTIMRILNGQSTLVILSTGGGKSLCYQLPAYLYAQRTKGITLVVSPLVSLMEDQITGLPRGVRGVCLHSSMTPAQRDSVLSDINAGRVHFLLVSPESVVGGGGRGQGSFPTADKLPPIFFACIDEVHCLSEWSHNFRPSYLRLCKVLREQYGVQCFLGLTATATKSTAADVARHLNISEIDEATVRGSPVPPNLTLSVSRDENRDEALVNLLKGKRFSQCSSIIIYCTRREQVERVATLIRTCLQCSDSTKRGRSKKPMGKKKKSGGATDIVILDPGDWSVEGYHAGLTAAQRKRVQQAFMSGALRVVVATVAFGMGLDKSDVRGVIHYNLPKSFENYVQEVGRAGRDGLPAHCHLFLDPQGGDLRELQRHTFGNSVDRHTLKKLLLHVFAPCRCRQVQRLKGGPQSTEEEREQSAGEGEGVGGASSVCCGHERALIIQQLVNDLDVRAEGIETLLCYLELHVPHLVTCMSPAYATCHLQCYGGPTQLQAVAKKCPPVAVAIAKQKMEGKAFSTANSVEFNVIQLSDSMGWKSGIVKRELKALLWTVSPDQGARKSGVIVTFTDLAMRVCASGDVRDREMDELLDFLHMRTTRQERAELAQLSLLTQRLRSVSHKNYWMCSEEVEEARSRTLRRYLDDHFDDKDIQDSTTLAQEEDREVEAGALSALQGEVRQFVQLYGSDQPLTGRSVARVLHGIDSPRFPAAVWGKVRRFWRSQLHLPFPAVLREASRQLLQLR